MPPEASRPALPVLVLPPAAPAIALVCDSPHSGTDYPADFDYAVDAAELRKCEDTHVQWLWDAVPRVGGPTESPASGDSPGEDSRHRGG